MSDPKGKAAKKLYAQLAGEAYRRADAKDVDPFVVVKEYGKANSVVFESPDSIVLSIRGTNMKNPEDLATDAAVLAGALNLSRRYREIKSRLKTLIKKYPGKKILLTGHSLGGTIAINLLADYPKKIHEIHIYNPFSTTNTAISGVTNTVLAKFGSSAAKMIKRKTHIYHVPGDVLSFMSRFSSGNYHDQHSSSLNPIERHSISEFKQKSAEPAAAEPEPVVAPEPAVVPENVGGDMNDFDQLHTINLGDYIPQDFNDYISNVMKPHLSKLNVEMNKAAKPRRPIVMATKPDIPEIDNGNSHERNVHLAMMYSRMKVNEMRNIIKSRHLNIPKTIPKANLILLLVETHETDPKKNKLESDYVIPKV
jgi:hypothetical protein